MARPSKAEQWLTEDGLRMLTHWKRADLTDAEIAKRIGIVERTFCDWKARYPQIMNAMKKGIEYCIADAEEALLWKFKTQTLVEEKEEIWQDADGSTKKHKVITKKQIPPDTAAIIFYLKSKAGWRDTPDARSISVQISNERRKEIEDFFDAQ